MPRSSTRRNPTVFRTRKGDRRSRAKRREDKARADAEEAPVEDRKTAASGEVANDRVIAYKAGEGV